MDLLQMSFSASILIVAIVIIRAVALHKLPKKTFLALWGIVVLRLFVPFSIPFRFSVYTGLDYLKSLFVQRSAASFPKGMAGLTTNTFVSNMEELSIIGVSGSSASTIESIWMMGMCVCSIFFIFAYIKCRREFKMSLSVKNDIVASWSREHPLCRPLQIRQTDRIKAPLTYGVLRPVILLPKKMDWEDEKCLHYVLTHENVHIRRFDALTKLVLAAAVCVHWFNPFAWAMYVLANRDIELSCDETVVRTLGESIKSAYALMLIGFEETKGRLSPLINHFSKNAIEERIVSIMKIKKASLVGIIVALVLVAGVATAFATSASTMNNRLIKEATNASTEQGRSIQNELAEVGINIESIGLSSNTFIEGMDENWEAYDIISKEGNTFLLILRKDDKDFTAILDSENNLIAGIVDGGVLPQYFKEK